MFSFNFGSVDNEVYISSDEEIESAAKIEPSDVGKLEFVHENNFLSLPQDCKIATLSKENIAVLLERDHDLSIQKAECSHSDLVPGVYEGGLKIWESTYDLCEYLLTNKDVSLKDKVVLDLGCGAGILGIAAKKLGAKAVHFQDYNSGVLKNLTIPNVGINFSSFDDFEFWSGDWSGLRQKNMYDVILTSETIYNTKNYSKIHRLFRNNLKSSGVIYVAAKLYYFGVGGSVSEFCHFLDKKNIFTWEKVFTENEGVKRTILMLLFKPVADNT